MPASSPPGVLGGCGVLGTKTHGDGGCGQVRRGWGSARVQGQLCKAGAGARSSGTLASGRRYGAELLLAGTVFFFFVATISCN